MNDSPWLVAGLCAQWCGTCRDWRAVFDAQARASGSELRFVWIDVEDEADALGPLDIENFPTLLIARGHEPLFFGTILPHAQTLARLLQSARAGDMKPLHDAALSELVGRVREIAGN